MPLHTKILDKTETGLGVEIEEGHRNGTITVETSIRELEEYVQITQLNRDTGELDTVYLRPEIVGELVSRFASKSGGSE